MKTKTKTKKKKEEPNLLKTLIFNITTPFKMDQSIDFKQLAVFVGKNASGKSFVLKSAYALGTVGKMRTAPPGPNSAAQFVFDNTFVNQNFNGTFKAIYTKGSVSIDLKDGQVVNSEVQGQTMPVTYMSSNLRTFNAMVMYLHMRKTAGNEPIAFMKKILETYRLYDVTYMEGLLARMPIVLPDRIKSALKAFDFEENIASIEVDPDACEFYAVLDDGSKKIITTYGSGHQAMLNMMIGAA